MTPERRYVHVFPISEFFRELRDCYRSASTRLTWMSAEDLSDWHPGRPEWNDPELVLIFWGRFPSVPDRRRAALVFRYTESVGDPELLAQVQRDLMQDFAARASVPDLLLAGCPSVADYWSRMCRAVAVAPIGYEPNVLGRPDWGAQKKYPVGYRGHYIERRTWAVRWLQQKMGPRFRWVHGFGLDRKRQLDVCAVDLYVGHSIEYGFPGARLWQSIATSAALATERRDVWPAVPGRHYVELPVFDHDDRGKFMSALRETFDHAPLEQISRTAHAELSAYTVDRCMEEFVVPATKGLRG